MRLLSVVNASGASAYYRQILPAETLRRVGYDATWKLLGDATDADALRADVIVLGRLGGEQAAQAAASIRHLQSLGKTVIVDYDDLVTAIPKWNPAHLAETDDTIGVIQSASGITTTNSALASEMRAFNPNVTVFPNYVHPNDWEVPQPKNDIVIGLAGTPSHGKDWELIREPMQRIRRDFPDVQFVIAGFMPDYLKDVATEFVDWVPMTAYPSLLKRFSIGLCPLVDDRFNRCKSPIKCYEYALSGAAVVASPTQYASVVRGKGVIARTADEWYEGIKRYIVDADARQRDAQALRSFVIRTLDAQKHARDIFQAYNSIHKRIK